MLMKPKNFKRNGDTLYHGLEDSTPCIISTSLIHRFNTVSSYIAGRCFVDIEKMILKFIWKGKETRIDKTTLKKNKVGMRVCLPYFMTCYIVTAIQTVRHLQRGRHINQWKIVENTKT